MNGIDGRDGRNGTNGFDGKDGEQGISGFSGYSGKEGPMPETEDMVDEVIKELKKKQYLEPKDIKGMPINMNDMRWHGSGGGSSGGSGESGASGTSGYSGAEGTSGFSGYSGEGSSGESGTSGYSGYSGATGGGSSSLNVIDITSDYYVTPTDDVINVNAVSGNIKVYLLPLADAPIKPLRTRRTDDTGNTVTVAAFSTPSTQTFSAVGTFDAEVLIVGGGAGGGAQAPGVDGGGAGAGGVLNGTLSLSTGDYSLTVGNGGVGGIASSGDGQNGGDSVFDIYTAFGGGKGGGANNGGGNLDGGSGGGTGGNVGNTGLTTQTSQGPLTGYGNNGGGPTSPNPAFGGSGGGATAPGDSGNPNLTGGAGFDSSITGTLITYATGGGENTQQHTGVDGLGEGGSGGYTDNGFNGGSGTVIIRYLTADGAGSTGGDITTDGDYTIHTFASIPGITETINGETTQPLEQYDAMELIPDNEIMWGIY